MEPPARRRRTSFVALGILAIIASVLWALVWGMVALFASAFGGDTSGWVIVSVALALGVLVFVVGVSLVRGRRPNRWGWLVVSGAALAPFLLVLGSWAEDREADPVNRVVQRIYMERTGLQNIKAACDKIEETRDGSESWICEMGFEAEYDICDVDINRKQGLIAADIDFCLLDDSRALSRSEWIKEAEATCARTGDALDDLDPSNFDSQKDFAHAVDDVFGDYLAELRALIPPRRDRGTITQWLDLQERLAEAWKIYLVSDGKETATEIFVRKATPISERADRLIHRFGADGCTLTRPR